MLNHLLFHLRLPPPPPDATEIKCEEWTAQGLYPIIIAGEPKAYFANNFLVVIKKFQGNLKYIKRIEFLVKGEGFDAKISQEGMLFELRPDSKELSEWRMKDSDKASLSNESKKSSETDIKSMKLNGWKEYIEFIQNYTGRFLYTSLRIHYEDEKKKFSGIFYARLLHHTHL